MSSITAAPAPASASPQSRQRWLLLGSLALNLFFIGIAIAFFVREPVLGSRDRNMAARIERIAETLPPADADKLRGQFQANRTAVETARANLDAAREATRETLRHDPFNADAMRAAMAQIRAARQNYDQVLHGIVSGAAAQMTPAGRRDLSNFRSDQARSARQ
jgi:uncharacterized membrane protein